MRDLVNGIFVSGQCKWYYILPTQRVMNAMHA